jgi:hypothetical protein
VKFPAEQTAEAAMIENDFTFLWNAGQTLLHGQNPYTIALFVYPPALLPLFALFGLLPKAAGFWVFTAINLGMFLYLLLRQPYRRSNLAWLLYTPALFILIVGQLDILFLWAAQGLEKKDGRAVLAAAFLTLKPQLALFLLPIPLLTWLKRDRRSLAAWAALTLALYLLPALLFPSLVSGWLAQMQGAAGLYQTITPGIFALPLTGAARVGLFACAAALLGGALFLPPQALTAALLLAAPLGAWYNDVVLTRRLPLRILLPAGWLAVGLAVALKASYPFVLIPLSALGWYVWAQRRDPQPTLLDWLRASGEPGARGERQA